MDERDGMLFSAIKVMSPSISEVSNRLGLTASGYRAEYKDDTENCIYDTVQELLDMYDHVVIDILEFKEYVPLMIGESKNPKHGFIYFITDGELVKIGQAVNIDKRMKGIQTGNSREIMQLQIIEVDDMDRVEQSLHYWFEPYRKHGEWFDLLNLFGLDRMTCIRRVLGEKCLEFGYRITVNITDGSCKEQPIRLWEKSIRIKPGNAG